MNNYDDLFKRLHDKQTELHYTNKQIAELTDTPTSTFSRYWSGETRAPFEFVVKVAYCLGVALDPPQEDEQTAKQAENIATEAARSIAEQIRDKNEQIESMGVQIIKLRETLDKREETLYNIHERYIEHIEELRQEYLLREDRKNALIKTQFRFLVLLTAIAVAFAVYSVYFTLDASHGDWGIIRYPEETISETENLTLETEDSTPAFANQK